MMWYRMDRQEVLEVLETDGHGLDAGQVLQRLEACGPNRLGEEERISRCRVLLHQFTSPLIYLLLIAAIITFLLREFIDTGVILAVVVLNAVIGFTQEMKAEEGYVR